MTLKLATIWEGVAVYVTANGEAFTLTKFLGLKLRKTFTNGLGHHAKKYNDRYYEKFHVSTRHPSGPQSYKNYWLHILVCTAFHGPRPSPKHQVDHINRDRFDNRPENLRWVTPHENQMNNILHIRKLERLEREKQQRECFNCREIASRTLPVQLSINF